MKRFLICMALAAGMLLASCEKQTSDTPVPDAPNKPDTAIKAEDTGEEAAKEPQIDVTADLSAERYDGYTYRILVRKGQTNTQYFAEQQDDIVDDAIYRRNKAVEERFGVTVECAEGTGSNTDISALNGIIAGDDAYDIIFTHSRSAFSYALQGAAYNAREIGTLHLDKPWWSPNCVESCTVGGNLYVLDGDISINGLANAMTLFFNKRIFDELGFDYPYEDVKDGSWTFDEFAYLARKGAKDLNGDGVITPDADQYGFMTGDWAAPINILYAGGGKVFEKNEEGILELSLYTNKTVSVFDRFFTLMDNEACYIRRTGADGTYPYETAFRDGRVMFSAEALGSSKRFRNMEDDFGILPYPVFDEGDPYTTAINGYAPLAVIPITVSDKERTGAITEALAAYGHEYVLPAFYDVSLKTKYARDTDSEAMMDIIRGSLVFDIGYLCGSTYESHGHDLAISADHDFASWYKARESQAKINLENFNRTYGGIGNEEA